ncbi:type 4 prepilin peptidase 1 [Azorhizobium oxalatiphilum]|uniref:Type 4 prepilin peptidase 1 n=1 Tax=Azorhizobium oxalatiphilum TaxID=980631 RepID=A0A917FD70_9HYPH|nr:prepilin peptidase [Azorhizobium oxalatiphilum]GGF64019.1 type 4 prepilin peptidase 1 [Azorhizobium oxalatiphilum]
MPTALAAELIASALLPVALVTALASDLYSRTIPNLVVLALLLGFGVLAALGHVADVPLRLVLAGALLAVGFALFAEDVIGAGDAKLAAATALWLDPTQFPVFVLICGGLGGLLVAAVTLAARRNAAAGHPADAGLARGLPYGVALAFGGLVLFPQSSIALAAPFAL